MDPQSTPQSPSPSPSQSQSQSSSPSPHSDLRAPRFSVPTWPEIEASADSLEVRLHDAIQRFLAGDSEDAAREFREINNAYTPLKSAVVLRKAIDKRHDELADRAERAALRAQQAASSQPTQPALVSIDRRALDALKGVDAAHDGSDRFRTADFADPHRNDPFAADDPFLAGDDDRDADDLDDDFDPDDPDAGDLDLD